MVILQSMCAIYLDGRPETRSEQSCSHTIRRFVRDDGAIKGVQVTPDRTQRAHEARVRLQDCARTLRTVRRVVRDTSTVYGTKRRATAVQPPKTLSARASINSKFGANGSGPEVDVEIELWS